MTTLNPDKLAIAAPLFADNTPCGADMHVLQLFFLRAHRRHTQSSKTSTTGRGPPLDRAPKPTYAIYCCMSSLSDVLRQPTRMGTLGCTHLRAHTISTTTGRRPRGCSSSETYWNLGRDKIHLFHPRGHARHRSYILLQDLDIDANYLGKIPQRTHCYVQGGRVRGIGSANSPQRRGKARRWGIFKKTHFGECALGFKGNWSTVHCASHVLYQ